MNRQKTVFQEECRALTGAFPKITQEPYEDPVLSEIEQIFGAADRLSLVNAEKHRRILLALSIAGTILALSFLLYDEADMYSLIFACGVMLLVLFVLNRLSKRLECHRKYVEYRVLAESLRLQFFLRFAGLKEKVTEIMPWSIRLGAPWIPEVIADIDTVHEGSALTRRPIKECWVDAQLAYHRSALLKTKKKDLIDRRIVRVVFVLTICVYLFALFFEIRMIVNPIETPIGASVNVETVYRAALKILLGTLSAITLFSGAYFGKMSLSNVIDDHQRMIALYERAAADISLEGENENILHELAREYLNENSCWYAYQSKNDTDIVL